jgi:hypothetical protein
MCDSYLRRAHALMRVRRATSERAHTPRLYGVDGRTHAQHFLCCGQSIDWTSPASLIHTVWQINHEATFAAASDIELAFIEGAMHKHMWYTKACVGEWVVARAEVSVCCIAWVLVRTCLNVRQRCHPYQAQGTRRAS